MEAQSRLPVAAAVADKRIGAVVFFGPPGAGKGTQAKGIAPRLGIPHVSTGDMIRAQVAAHTPAGNTARAIMERGDLVSDELVNQMVAERLTQPDSRRGVVLDGYPRTIRQAQALESMLAESGSPITVVNLTVNPEEVVRRITGRRMCPRCGTIYNRHLQPSARRELCDLDGTPLVSRADDREEVVRERLAAYDRETRPVLDYFRAKGQTIFELDGQRPADEISNRLCQLLDPA